MGRGLAALLSRRRYEALALALAVLGASLHLVASVPRVGEPREATTGEALIRALQSLEGRVTDLQFRLRGPVAVHPDVVVVAIDERGAQRHGLWPWPRDVIAGVIDRLLEAGAAVVGLDIAFTDATAPAQGAQALLARLRAAGELPPALEALRGDLEAAAGATPDDALEAALRRAGPRVVQSAIPFREEELAALSEARRREDAELARPFVIREIALAPGVVRALPVDRVRLWTYLGVQMPLRRFATAGTGVGQYATVRDVDGAVRRAPALIRLSEPSGFLPSMPLAAVARARQADVVPVFDASDALSALRLRGPAGDVARIPMEGQAPFLLVNYPGPASRVPTVSVADVLDGALPPGALQGKVALVGVTITGLTGDQVVTPFGTAPGVFTHAAVASNLLAGDPLSRPSSLVLVEAGLLVLLALGLAVAIPRLRFALKLGAVVAVALGWVVASQVAFRSGVQLAVGVPLVTLLTSSFAVVFLGYLSVDREKARLRGAFSRYLGEEVMAIALENPDRLNRGEKREMTVLFSDIRGFTGLAERMAPEALARFINEYLSPMTQLVFEEGGTLDKYIGDAVMAFWNAPLDQPDHALRACRAAIKMLRTLETLRTRWKAAGLPELEIGIGINTGPMVVGNMGSDVRVDYTVLGDAVNLASRLEASTKDYEVSVVVSEATWLQAREHLTGRRLGAVRVRGKQQPVRVYELRHLGPAAEGEGETIAAFERALTAWEARRFTEAAALFREVLARWPQDLAARQYLADAEAFAAAPPPAEWDGVASLETK